jgi:hypothetical protein
MSRLLSLGLKWPKTELKMARFAPVQNMYVHGDPEMAHYVMLIWAI